MISQTIRAFTDVVSDVRQPKAASIYATTNTCFSCTYGCQGTCNTCDQTP